jgi:hypothetical protein
MGFEDPLMMTVLVLAGLLLALNAGVWWFARGRMDPRLAPRALPPTDGMLVQLAATLGTGAAPRRTLSETRLRASWGLRAVLMGASVGFGAVLMRLHDADMLRLAQGAVPWPELLLLGLLVWHTVAMWTWELRFDAVGLSAPVLICGRRARLWRALVAVTDDGPFTLRFHFADGAVIGVPKHVVGREALLHMADHWLSHDQGPPDARTARG